PSRARPNRPWWTYGPLIQEPAGRTAAPDDRAWRRPLHRGAPRPRPPAAARPGRGRGRAGLDPGLARVADPVGPVRRRVLGPGQAQPLRWRGDRRHDLRTGTPRRAGHPPEDPRRGGRRRPARRLHQPPPRRGTGRPRPPP